MGTKSRTACRFAPLTTIDSGIPRPSTRTLRFVPFFPPIRRVGPDGLLGQGRFPESRIDTLPRPGDSFELVVFRQALSPQSDEDPGALPGEEVFVDGAGTPELHLGQRLPLTACAQHIHNALEDAPGVQRFPPAPGLALVPVPL